MKAALLISAISALLLTATSALASPIYVYREADGVIRFTSRPPVNGERAQVFTARTGSYSTVSSSGWRFFSRTRLNRNAYNDIIKRVAEEHQVDPALVKAIIHVESSFNPKAVSRKGAQGLMQLMPGTARHHGVIRPFEPMENIAGGTRHIASLLRKYGGNVSYALAAYNAGEEAVHQYGGIPPYNETREYVRRVQFLKERYSTQG